MNHVPESGAENLATLKNHYPGMLATMISLQHSWVMRRTTEFHLLLMMGQGLLLPVCLLHIKDLGMRSITKTFKNSESNPSPEETWHQGWLSSSRDHTVTSPVAPSLTHPPGPKPGRKQNFSELAAWPLQHMPPESSNLSVLTWEQLLEKHEVLSAGKSKLFMWESLWLLSCSFCSEKQPGSSLMSSLRLQFGGLFLCHHQIFSPIFQLHSSKKICTDCNQQPRSLVFLQRNKLSSLPILLTHFSTHLSISESHSIFQNYFYFSLHQQARCDCDGLKM